MRKGFILIIGSEGFKPSTKSSQPTRKTNDNNLEFLLLSGLFGVSPKELGLFSSKKMPLEGSKLKGSVFAVGFFT
jgi:hypothetical protein